MFSIVFHSWEANVKVDLKQIGWEDVDLIGLDQETDGGLVTMWRRQRSFGSHEMREISWLAEELFALQEVFYDMELVSYLFPSRQLYQPVV